MLVVVAVGLFSGYLYWLKNSASSIQVLTKKQPAVSKKAGSGDDQFHFDFFSMLPDEEYIGIEERKEAVKSQPKKKPVNKKERAKKSKPVPTKAAHSAVPTGNYQIQMGAFRRRDAAEQHKAELILMGVEHVQIDTVKSAKGSLFRVNVGPFQSFSSAEHRQSQLKRAGYDSFLKKYASH